MGRVAEKERRAQPSCGGQACCAATTEATEGVAARSIVLKWGAAVLRPYDLLAALLYGYGFGGGSGSRRGDFFYGYVGGEIVR